MSYLTGMLTVTLALGLVALPALVNMVVFLTSRSFSGRRFGIGDPIVYRKQKVSTRPGAHARDIYPAGQGDYYYYLVNKFWTVVDILDDGSIVARTRTDKRHLLMPTDPNLRKANLTERVRFGRRFPGSGQPAV